MSAFAMDIDFFIYSTNEICCRNMRWRSARENDASVVIFTQTDTEQRMQYARSTIHIT